MNLFTCLHLEISSDFLFTNCFFEVIIWNFSAKHRLHDFDPFLYAGALSIISQDNIGLFMPEFFNSQKWFDNCVFMIEGVFMRIPSAFKSIIGIGIGKSIIGIGKVYM